MLEIILHPRTEPLERRVHAHIVVSFVGSLERMLYPQIAFSLWEGFSFPSQPLVPDAALARNRPALAAFKDLGSLLQHTITHQPSLPTNIQKHLQLGTLLPATQEVVPRVSLSTLHTGKSGQDACLDPNNHNKASRDRLTFSLSATPKGS